MAMNSKTGHGAGGVLVQKFSYVIFITDLNLCRYSDTSALDKIGSTDVNSVGCSRDIDIM